MLSSLARYSQELGLKRIFEILRVLFEKISVFYADWPKSWIWWTLRHVRNIFCKCHLQNAQKNVTFEPVHGIQNYSVKTNIVTTIKVRIPKQVSEIMSKKIHITGAKVVHFKKTVARSSFLTKQSQLMLYWKVPQFWKKWGSCNYVLKIFLYYFM